MTKPVALSNATYERLRRQKHPSESFSQAIDRLIRDQRRDPMSFVARVPRSRRPAKKRLAEIEASREDSWEPA